MPDTDPLLTVHLSEPGEVAAAVPHLIGFRPRESLVVVSLRGGRTRRFGLTARIDLPPAEHRAAVVGGLVHSLMTDRPAAVVLAVVSEAPDDLAVDRWPGGADHRPTLPHRDLVHEAVLAFAGRSVPVQETLLVRRGRWWSYDCPRPCCAPDAGTPLPGGTSALAAASAVSGQVLAEDRAELARRIAPVGFLAAAGTSRACDEVGLDVARVTAERGREDVAEESWAEVRRALLRTAPGSVGAITDHEVARVAWALRDIGVRDRALALALGRRAAAAEGLWTEVTRRAPPPLDAAPATLLAVSAWLRGDGAMANVALERALDSDPAYPFAGLLRTALDHCMPPAELRRLIAETTDPFDAAS
ncbi:DUF4192 domain-containing protein [Modestobacter marinus]|uniref:DUF4192 domain-containing protein n=1 Tax=Modestobacter marinus TaxID=477641 RepID=UPI001C98C5C5|nr:DUF4192 domain-containing protein [Modestobacter marinus]